MYSAGFLRPILCQTTASVNSILSTSTSHFLDYLSGVFLLSRSVVPAVSGRSVVRGPVSSNPVPVPALPQSRCILRAPVLPLPFIAALTDSSIKTITAVTDVFYDFLLDWAFKCLWVESCVSRLCPLLFLFFSSSVWFRNWFTTCFPFSNSFYCVCEFFRFTISPPSSIREWSSSARCVCLFVLFEYVSNFWLWQQFIAFFLFIAVVPKILGYHPVYLPVPKAPFRKLSPSAFPVQII